MDNDYLKFNDWAFQYYVERNSVSNIGTLAIEVTEIQNYCKEYDCDLKFKEIINCDWSKLLYQETNNIPKYFGLIALQCFAASKMQYDGISETGINDYQTRFIEVSGITNTQELQSKFKSEFMGNPIQEKIWIEAKKFLSNMDFEIHIPSPSNGAGRYVQYPKKQVVLNQEDLKEYFDFFEAIKEEFEVISFVGFKKYFKNNINKFKFKRKNNLKNDRSQNENNIKLKQIFDYYCSENWSVKVKSLEIIKINIEEPKYILSYNKFAETKIQLYNTHNECIDFSKTMFHKSRIKGILFFKKSDEYENEFDSVNYLENETEYILVANNDSNSNDLKIIKEYFESINFNTEKLYFFRGKIDANSLPSEFIELINEPYPLKLVGVKISRKKHYLINFPPKIINDKNKDYRVYPEYNIDDVKLGKYQIRVAGYSNLNFEIIENPKLKEIVHSREIGLKISDLNIVENGYNAQGLFYSENQKLRQDSLNINSWIDIQNGNLNAKQKMQTNNIILKALTEYKNGR